MDSCTHAYLTEHSESVQPIQHRAPFWRFCFLDPKCKIRVKSLLQEHSDALPIWNETGSKQQSFDRYLLDALPPYQVSYRRRKMDDERLTLINTTHGFG